MKDFEIKTEENSGIEYMTMTVPDYKAAMDKALDGEDPAKMLATPPSKEIRIFNSLSNRRLEEAGETTEEYKVRRKHNNKNIKNYLKGRLKQ